MEVTMPYRRTRRRIPRDRMTPEPTPEQRADWAYHHANLRARLAANAAGDHALALRLRQEQLAHDDMKGTR
jgi:hypothetical protein